MGFDLDRFEGSIDSELKCAICCGVFEDPLQAADCEHIFCSKCIHEWLRTSSTCPVDRKPLDCDHLQAAPRIVRNLLNRLKIRCDFQPTGCQIWLTMEQLNTHRYQCEHNPDAPRPCPRRCGANVIGRLLEQHDCVRELRQMLSEQQLAIGELRASVSHLLRLANEQRDASSRNGRLVDSLGEQYKQLEASISNLEQPIQRLLLVQAGKYLNDESNSRKKGHSASIDSDENSEPDSSDKENSHSTTVAVMRNQLAREVTTDIYLSGIEQQVPQKALCEYIAKKQVNLLKCELANRRGTVNDFRLTVLKSDAKKLLDSEMWPLGVSCFICGRFYDTKIEGCKTVDMENSTAPPLPLWMNS